LSEMRTLVEDGGGVGVDGPEGLPGESAEPAEGIAQYFLVFWRREFGEPVVLSAGYVVISTDAAGKVVVGLGSPRGPDPLWPCSTSPAKLSTRNVFPT